MGQWGYERQHDALDVDGEAEAERRDALEGVRDWVDDHVDRWQPVLPSLNPHVEGAVTRMQFLADHLRHAGERALAELGLRREEHEALHMLAGHGGRRNLTQLALDLGAAPNTLAERLDVLERRGFVTRTATGGRGAAGSGQDDELVLTEEGHSTWLAAIEAAGEEERRLFGALDWHEQRLLAGLLRQIMLATGPYEEDGEADESRDD
ncbi:MarR family winged helix-turn-helix transcriptional regulator [Streptomyces spirodelae]|uniref:Winged helix-turn-helix transcriptional regulator n=1 Tax=Streptomyces spirodelae TaxID=2812904 RepID=A0ABS3X1Y0_9ACTN|nr:MarR family winged helix-turn-helix transcriptional regulator [Streptomyces spirodelae]MBO8189081.1 winged helix-turn-helix transcriptional regulator [Streptomyces spirodelae]